MLLISTPFSNLVAASVRKPCLSDVMRIASLLNQALSKNIVVVFFVTPLSSPPYTPAMHMLSVALAIIKSVANNFLSLPSNVLKTSPSFALRTTILFPAILAASKACNGCPVSCKIKLVASTILFIGFRPIAFNLFCNQLGLSPTVTLLILTPA